MDLALAVLEKYLQTKNPAALVKFWQLYPKPVPSWHLTMMNDQPRNQFYEKEIISKCEGKIVLDVGCGSGLLTQYALEAGAKHVYSIELDPVLQTCFKHAFKKEIEEGRVTLIAKPSQELNQEDLKAGAPEVVIHEIFGFALFNEGVIETFTDLFKRNLINPSMKFIPQKFSLWAALHNQPFESKIKDPKYSDQFWFLEDISHYGIPMNQTNDQNQLSVDVSSGMELHSIDLKNLSEKIEAENEFEATTDGNMLRVWFKLIGEHSTLSTDLKENPGNHWGNNKYFLKFQAGKVLIKSSYKDRRFLPYVK
jgi:predicted RNA methylase